MAWTVDFTTVAVDGTVEINVVLDNAVVVFVAVVKTVPVKVVLATRVEVDVT